MFKYLNQFITAERNGLDDLVLDEAHRIRETSVDRYTRAELRTDRPQIDELIAAARVPVFLLDEHQIVRPGEMGSLETDPAPRRIPRPRGAHPQLDEQFRCGGSGRSAVGEAPAGARRRRTGPVERRPSVHRPRRPTLRRSSSTC